MIEAFEINLYRKWRRLDTNEIFSFLPGKYDDEFKDYYMALIEDDSGKTFKIGFKVFEEENKAILLIVDKKFEIKRIDGSVKPATMILIDESENEIDFVEEL